MVETNIRKIRRDEILVCEVCNNAIPKDFLKKNAGRVQFLYCQYCGVALNLNNNHYNNIESAEKPNITIRNPEEVSRGNFQQTTEKSDVSLSHSNIRNAVRCYIFQLIYQMLKSTPFTLKKIQNKKELKSSHINIVLKKIWKELKGLSPNDISSHKLVSSKRKINNYFEDFQSTLRPYKNFRRRNFTLFAENIEFIFGLILGDYEFSNLAPSKKHVVLDLKKSFGFKSDTTTTKSFTYNISLVICKKIRSILNQYHISEGKDNKVAFDELISNIIENLVYSRKNLLKKSELNHSKQKKFHKTLGILINDLKIDWIYRKSFEDHIYRLIVLVNSLRIDSDYISSLSGFERLIYQGLKHSALFEKDQDFTPHFKLNLTLILCRIIFLKIKKSPELAKLNSVSTKLSLMDENLIQNSIIDDITAGQKINSQLLKTFYKLFLEEFQTYYKKLQYKLTSDLIYVESFRDYIRDLVKLVFNIVNSISKKSHLTKLELAVIKDLANYNFDWFYTKPERTYFYYVNSTNHTKEDPDKEPCLTNRLSSPSDVVNYYYEDIGGCRYGKNEFKQFIRHNFEIIAKKKNIIQLGNDKNSIKLKCKHCNYTIQNSLEGIERIKGFKKIQPLYNVASAGSMYIYRIHWQKDMKGDWLQFPGSNYIGQTDRNPIQRYEEHLKRAFESPRINIEKLMSFYAKNIKEARKLFKLEVLQVIDFQGNEIEINNIVDGLERKKNMKNSQIKTQLLTDTAEEFWIGFYHSQFEEFGYNIHKGGKIGKKGFTIYPFLDIHNTFKELACISFMSAVKPFFQNILKKKLDEKFSYWILDKNLSMYYPELATFSKIHSDYQKDLVFNYFEQGFMVYNIVEILNDLAKEIDPSFKGPHDELISGLIKEKIQKEFPSISLNSKDNIGSFRADVIKSKMEKYIKNAKHRINYRELLQIFPGFQSKDVLKDFTRRHKISLIELNDKYYPDSVYWARAADVLRDKGNSISIYDFLVEIGLKENYSEKSLKRGSRIIKNRFEGFTFSELINLVCDGKFPIQFENQKEKFMSLINSKADNHYYLSKAVMLIKQNPQKYDAPKILLYDLGGMSFSESTIETQADRCLKRTFGYDLNGLKILALK
ncbi:MAG: hypothetical protein ACTSQU_04575 [Promethearchaeota archaeon]